MEAAFHSDALDDCRDFFAGADAPHAYAVVAGPSDEDTIFGNLCRGLSVALAMPLRFGRCETGAVLLHAAINEPIAPSFAPYRHVQGARNALRHSRYQTGEL